MQTSEYGVNDTLYSLQSEERFFEDDLIRFNYVGASKNSNFWRIEVN
jgi:hypothetical protein